MACRDRADRFKLLYKALERAESGKWRLSSSMELLTLAASEKDDASGDSRVAEAATDGDDPSVEEAKALVQPVTGQSMLMERSLPLLFFVIVTADWKHLTLSAP
ncbi:hypothetical protein PC116_g15716 [Phytophthora cactorum]|nr:hypothetical protein PC116_g15716 [Phytophthora cactorum]